MEWGNRKEILPRYSLNNNEKATINKIIITFLSKLELEVFSASI